MLLIEREILNDRVILNKLPKRECRQAAWRQEHCHPRVQKGKTNKFKRVWSHSAMILWLRL